MDERILHFRIGAFVVFAFFALFALFIIVCYVAGDGQSVVEVLQLAKPYTIYIDFPEASGVNATTPIYKSGVRIGSVTKVDLRDDGVRITAKIYEGRSIFTDEVPRLTHSLINNDAVIEFTRATPRPVDPGNQPSAAAPPPGHSAANDGRVQSVAEVPAEDKRMPVILTAFRWTNNQASPPAPGGGAPNPFPPRTKIKPGAEIRGQVAPDAMQAMANFQQQIGRAIDCVGSTSEKFNNLADKLNGVLGSQEELAAQKKQIATILEKTGPALDDIRNMANGVNDLVISPDLQQAMKNLPKVMDDARKTLTQMNNAIDLVDRNLQNLDTFTTALGKDGPSTLDRIDQAAGHLDQLMCQLNDFGKAMNNENGSLGKLLYDDHLYNNLNSAASNIKDLTVQLQPVIHDARVFSDKIARHPETLGVRGAINPGPGTKGLPSLPPLGGSSGRSDDPYQDGRQLRFDPN